MSKVNTPQLDAQFTTVSDVYELDSRTGTFELVGTKLFGPPDGRPSINKWFDRPRGTVVCPPLSSALDVYTGVVRCDSLTPNSTGYLCSKGADVGGSAKLVFFVSSAYGNGNGTSITPDVFKKSMIIFSVRQAIPATWLNDRDQFTIPHTEPDDVFYGDCLAYALFHGSNQTSSLKNVMYKGQKYQVRNQFFPYEPQQFQLLVSDVGMNRQLDRAKPTFVYQELQKLQLSPEAGALLDLGLKVYQLFYANLPKIDRNQYKIDYWDVGWYQIRNALKTAGIGETELKEVDVAHKALGKKIEPQVYSLGFLRP